MTALLERPRPAAADPVELGRARRGPRWRADLRLARRQVGRNRMASLLVIALIALPMSLVAGVLVFADGRQPTVDERITAELGQADAWVAVVNGPDPSLTQYDDQPLWFQIDRDEQTGVPKTEQAPMPASAEPFLTAFDTIEIGAGSVTVETSGGIAPMAAVVGDAGADALRGRFTLHAGRAATGAGEAMVSPGALARLGAKIGDTLTLAEPAGTYTITGVLSRAEDPDTAEVVFLPGTSANRALQKDVQQSRWYLTDRHPTRAEITALNHGGMVVFDRDLVKSPVFAAPYSGGYIWSVAALVAAGAAFAGYLVVLLAGAAFSVSARRQQRALAVAASVGASRGDVFRIVLWQGSVLGLAGGVLGAAVGICLGILALRLLDDGAVTSFWGVHIPWGMLAGVVLFAVAVGTIAAIVPARAATRGEVIAALRGARRPVSVRVSRPLWGLGLIAVGVAVTAAAAAWLAAINAERLVANDDVRRIICIWAIIAGPLLLQVGVILGGHWIIAQLARVLSRFGLAPRIAARDAAANPGRIVPAFAAIAACAFLAAVGLGSLALVMNQAQRGYWWGAPVDTMSIYAYPHTQPGGVPATADELAALHDRAAQVLARTGPAAEGTVWNQLDPRTYDEDWTLTNPHAVLRVPRVQRFEVCDDQGLPQNCLTPEAAMVRGYGDIAVVDPADLATVVGRSSSASDLARYRAGGVLLLDAAYATPKSTVVVNAVTAAAMDGAKGGVVDPVDTWELDAIVIELGGQHRNSPVMVSPAAAKRVGLETGGFQLVAAYGEAPSAAVEDAVRRDAAALGTPSVSVDARWEPGPADPAPSQIVLVAATAVLVIGASAISLGLARVERRPDDATLTAVGGSRGLRRAIAAWQAVIVAGIGMVTGVVAGILPVWGVSMAAQGSYNPPHFSDMPWVWLAVLALALPLVIAVVSWLVPPRRPDLTRRTAIA